MDIPRPLRKLQKALLDTIARKKAQFFPTGPKFVLFIGDEGAILVYIKDGVVKSRQFVADTEPQRLSELRDSLSSDPKAALLVVVDTIDQSYSQQTLPPVSSLSIKKLIKRRLDRDFGANDIKGAVVLGREASGRKDWNFMMISLEKTPLLATWIEFIESLPNRFQGFYLVAAEAEYIIKSLDRAVAAGHAEWKFLVSHNKVSGFRQVILRNGRVVFTRMAQPVGEATPEVMAGNIEQEMLSTIEYMRRLSFDPQAGLDIYIVTSAGIRSVLDTSKMNVAKNINVFTPYEVAQHLDIEGATQPADQFGDVVLAACIGKTEQHILTLHTPESGKLNQLYQMMQAQRAVAASLAVAGGLYGLFVLLAMYATYLDASSQEERKATQQQKLNSVRLAIQQSAMDVEKTNDIIDLYSQLLEERYTPLPLLNKVQQVMKPSIVVKGVEIAYEDRAKTDQKSLAPRAAELAAKVNEKPTPSMQVVANFTLEFAGVTTLEAFKPVSSQFISDLKQALPGYDVSYSRLPSIFSEDEKLDMTFGAGKAVPQNPVGSQSMDVILTIRGNAAITASLAPSAALPQVAPAIQGGAP
jgi:hypothetical protein